MHDLYNENPYNKITYNESKTFITNDIYNESQYKERPLYENGNIIKAHATKADITKTLPNPMF